MYNATILTFKTKVSMIQMNQVLINTYSICTFFCRKHLLNKWLLKCSAKQRTPFFMLAGHYDYC